MTTFALIEQNSGYIWDIRQAETPEQAAADCTFDQDKESANYTRITTSEWQDDAGGYAIYEVPENWISEDIDGQDQELIEHITDNIKLVGYYRAAAFDGTYRVCVP